jgi:hypothetical protein
MKPIRIPKSSMIVRYVQKQGLYWLNLDSLTGRFYNGDVDELSLKDYWSPVALGDAVRAHVRSSDGFTILIRDNYGVERREINLGASDAPNMQHNSAYGPDIQQRVYSPDLMDSFTLPDSLQHWYIDIPIDSMCFVRSRSTGRIYSVEPKNFPDVQATPMRNSNPEDLVTDGVHWYGIVSRPALPRPTRHLLTFRLGELVTRNIDSLGVDGNRMLMRPVSMVRMWSDSIFYRDSTGFFAILRQGLMTTINVPFVPDRIKAEQEGLFLFQRSTDSVRIAFTDRSMWPEWYRWSCHIDFDRFANPGWDPFTLFGSVGFGMPRTTESDALLVSRLHPYPFEIGCLAAQDTLVSQLQAMVTTWHDNQGRPMVVSDQGCVTRIVRPGFGYVIHPLLLHDELGTRVQSLRSSRGTLPWTGIRRPHSWRTANDDTLVHTGAVVRRLHRSGDMLDTLATTPAQAWCRLDADRWAHANHRAVTIVGPTGATTLTVPYDTTTLRPGYASSLTPLLDGSLLVSYYGAVRTDSTLTAQPYRRGGMVRLRSDGTTASVALPSEAGGYVYPVHRMDDGTLLAMSATFFDDTVMGGDQNQQRLGNVRVLRSTDDGTTWRASSPLFYNGSWVPTTGRFLRTGPQTILGVMPTTIIVSTDNGATWDFDERFDASLSVCDIDITADTMLLATQKGLYQYVMTPTSVPDGEAGPLARSTRTMSRESFLAMMQEQGEGTIVVDLLGRRITDMQSIQGGMMVFMRTNQGNSHIIVQGY